MDVPPMQKLSPRQRELEAMKQPGLKYVELCSNCRGAGKIHGAVMVIECPSCHGQRFASAVDGGLASAEHLALELYEARKALASAIDNLNSKPLSTGPQAAYYSNNGRGAGGSNFTGD